MDQTTLRLLMAASGGNVAPVITTDVPNTSLNSWYVSGAGPIYSSTVLGVTGSPPTRNLTYNTTYNKYFYLFGNGIVGSSTNGIAWSFTTLDGFLEPNVNDFSGVANSNNTRPTCLTSNGSNLVGSIGPSVIVSEDGGVTWQNYGFVDATGSYNIQELTYNSSLNTWYAVLSFASGSTTYYYLYKCTGTVPKQLTAWTLAQTLTGSGTYPGVSYQYDPNNTSGGFLSYSNYVANTSNQWSTVSTSLTASTTYQFRSLTHGTVSGNNVYVTVGTNGSIFRSAANGNQLSWSQATSNTSNALYDIAFGTNIYVAVGATGTVVSSTDANTWIVRPANTKNAFYNVTWNGSAFLAVTNYFETVTSTDGITWTNNGTPLQTAMNVGVGDGSAEIMMDYSPTLGYYLAGGTGYGNTAVGGAIQNTANMLVTSGDGILWSNTTAPAFAGQTIQSVNWTGNVWTIGATAGKIATGNTLGSWTVVQTGSSSRIIDSASDGTTICAISYDPSLWIAAPQNGYENHNIEVLSGYQVPNGKGSVGRAGHRLYVSTDWGVTWTTRNIMLPVPWEWLYTYFSGGNSPNIYLQGIRYDTNMSRWILLATSSATSEKMYFTSVDGIEWSQTPYQAEITDTLYFSNNYFVLSGGCVYKSSDLNNFTTVLSSTANNFITGIANSTTTIAAGGLNGFLSTSTDGTTWTQNLGVANSGFNLLSMGYIDNKFYAATNFGTYTTTDNNATNWYLVPTKIIKVANTSGGFYAMGESMANSQAYFAEGFTRYMAWAADSAPNQWYPFFKRPKNLLMDFATPVTADGYVYTVGSANNYYDGTSGTITVNRHYFSDSSNVNVVTTSNTSTLSSLYALAQPFEAMHIGMTQSTVVINYSGSGVSGGASRTMSSSSWQGPWTISNGSMDECKPMPMHRSGRQGEVLITDKGYTLNSNITQWKRYADGQTFSHVSNGIAYSGFGKNAIFTPHTKQSYNGHLFFTNDESSGVWEWYGFGPRRTGQADSYRYSTTSMAAGYYGTQRPVVISENTGGQNFLMSCQDKGGSWNQISQSGPFSKVKYINALNGFVTTSNGYSNGGILYCNASDVSAFSTVFVGNNTFSAYDITYVANARRFIIAGSPIYLSATGQTGYYVSDQVTSMSDLGSVGWTAVTFPEALNVEFLVMSAYSSNKRMWFVLADAAFNTQKAGYSTSYDAITTSSGYTDIPLTYPGNRIYSFHAESSYNNNYGEIHDYAIGYGNGYVQATLAGYSVSYDLSQLGAGSITNVKVLHDSTNFGVYATDDQGYIYRCTSTSPSWTKTSVPNISGTANNKIVSIKVSGVDYTSSNTIALVQVTGSPEQQYLLFTPNSNVANLTMVRTQD